MTAKKVYLIVMAISLLLLAGCAKQDPSIELLSGDNSTPEIAPLQDTGTSDGGIITSSGTEIAGTAGESAPDTGEASQPGGGEVEGDVNTPGSWLTYVDSKYGFSVEYPDTYTLMDEPQAFNEILPDLIHRVRFLESYLAKSATANLQPPNFSVEVFQNPSATPLKSWIESNAPQGALENLKLGSTDCTRLTAATMMAPNEFYFCAVNGNIYRLIALGEYTDEMLKSFKFGQ